jgi:hypothetical protein
MSGGSVEVDSASWPIVLVRPRGELSELQYQQMFRAIEALWARKEKFLTITDTRRSGAGSARQRQLIGDWMKTHEEQSNLYSMGSIIIVSSAVVRGAMTAINWIAQPKVPSHFVSSPREAAEHARKFLLASGLRTDRVMELLETALHRLET